jgi:hypothetical protein
MLFAPMVVLHLLLEPGTYPQVLCGGSHVQSSMKVCAEAATQQVVVSHDTQRMNNLALPGTAGG